MVEASQDLPKRQVPIEDLILLNRKRTYRMFADANDGRPDDNLDVLKMKLQVKINANYAKIGEVPGITVDEFKRKKILRDLD
jgi:hypothetical protein